MTKHEPRSCAIECKQPFGYDATIWHTWDTLRSIEEKLGHGAAAQEAWRRARDSYLAYRCEGGTRKVARENSAT